MDPVDAKRAVAAHEALRSESGRPEPGPRAATESYSTRAAEARLPGSFLSEGKNVEYLEKKQEAAATVSNSNTYHKTENNSDRSNSQSKSSASDKLKGGGGRVSYRRHGVTAMKAAGGESGESKSEKSARRISLDDLSTAFQAGFSICRAAASLLRIWKNVYKKEFFSYILLYVQEVVTLQKKIIYLHQ